MQLPEGMVLTKEELNAVLARERAEADAASLAKPVTEERRTTSHVDLPFLGGI